MALTKIAAANGWTYLAGLADDSPPQALGRTDQVFSIEDAGGLGTHHGAFHSALPSSAILRVYFEHRKKEYNDLGYIQFCQLRSQGQVVPPNVLPALAQRRFYCSTKTKGLYLEFMGPKDANVRLKDGPCIIPFYALQASLTRQLTPLSDYEAFCAHPRPTGSIRRGDLQPFIPARFGKQANYASLNFPISPFLLTAGAIGERCTEESLVFEESLPADQVDPKPFFDVVTALYIADRGETVAGIDVQAVGPYLLITLDDGEEGVGGTVVVARMIADPENSSRRRISMWEIDRDTFAGIERQATRLALARLAEWFAKTGFRPKGPVGIPSEKQRGWGGLHPPPSLVYWNQGPVLELKLFSVVFARTRGTMECLPRAALTTRVTWKYDPILESLEIDAMQPVDQGGDADSIAAAIKEYLTAVNSPPDDDEFNESGFLVAGAPWYDRTPDFPASS